MNLWQKLLDALRPTQQHISPKPVFSYILVYLKADGTTHSRVFSTGAPLSQGECVTLTPDKYILRVMNICHVVYPSEILGELNADLAIPHVRVAPADPKEAGLNIEALGFTQKEGAENMFTYTLH